jgi:hypothetical protein
MKFVFKGAEYDISTKLDVAFAIQKAYDHEPYLQVLGSVDQMDLEEQIKLLYTAFNYRNPGVCTLKEFSDDFIDTGNVELLIEKIGELTEGVMYHGLSPEQIAEKKAQRQNLPEENREQRRKRKP